ncbi:MAG TPA: hypothetical protein VHC95_02360 [Opitutales bacterium]|nr:hypothetical protein [Opitutales bacterium]
MKTSAKLMMLSFVAATAAGSGFVLAQSPSPAAPLLGNRPAATVPAGGSGLLRGAGSGLGGRGGIGQPRMAAALVNLEEARRSLEAAVPDKGGFRDKAIKAVDEAIQDVKDGIEYARAHPEEFRGARGPARGAPPAVTATPAST